MRINFTPWAMHAQYYGGVAQGIYKAEGIDLEIRPPSAGQQNEVFIGTGREQFGVANADGFIRARGGGVPVVAIMADEPDTPFSVITLKKDNYTSPSQLKGKKISWFQSNVKGLLEPLLIKGGLTRNDIEYVNVARGAEVQMLAAGQVDAVFGYHFGQALTLDMRGFPTDVMPLKDHGVSFYGTVIYTSEQLLKSNPDLVKRFVRATLKSLDLDREQQGGGRRRGDQGVARSRSQARDQEARDHLRALQHARLCAALRPDERRQVAILDRYPRGRSHRPRQEADAPRRCTPTRSSKASMRRRRSPTWSRK